MDRYDSMAAFVRVADAHSFAGAARSLRLSTSVVSDRIRQLEGLLGVSLFHRTTRTVRLSEAGERFYDEAVDLVSRMSDIENRLRDGEGPLQGRLLLSSMVDFGISHLAPLILEFTGRNPSISIDLVLNNHIVSPVEAGLGETPDA